MFLEGTKNAEMRKRGNIMANTRTEEEIIISYLEAQERYNEGRIHELQEQIQLYPESDYLKRELDQKVAYAYLFKAMIRQLKEKRGDFDRLYAKKD